jgi:tetratricopeptide (TPR) repeat protein
MGENEVKMKDQLGYINKLVAINRPRLQGDIEQAIELAVEIADKWQRSCELCELIAYMYFEQALLNNEGENFEKAVYWLESAINIDEQNSRLHARLGDIYWLGILDYAAAATEYRQAIRLDHRNRRAYIGLAALYGPPESDITIEEAIESLKSAIELDSDDPNINARLGELLYESRREFEALEVWSRALSCSKSPEAGYLELIKVKLTEIERKP